MTDCPNAMMRDLLPDLPSGGLTGAERAAVEAHVASCADCAAELAMLQAMRRALRRAPAVDYARLGAVVAASTTARPQAVQLVGADRSSARTARWRDWRLAAAAVLVVAGGASMLLLDANRRSGPVRTAALEQPATVETMKGAATSVATAPPVPATPAAAAPTRPAADELELDATLALASDAELEALLADLDAVEAVPVAEPEPMPVGIPGGT